jgi:hypothetical protein
MSINELTSKVREQKEFREMGDELNVEITVIEDTLKAEMKARGTEEMTVEVSKVCWTKVNIRCFDTTAFKKTHADLYNIKAKSPCL